MTEVSVENPRISNLVKYEDGRAPHNMTREEVVVNVAAETTLTLGSVLGQVTSTGKYEPRDPAATTGEEVSAAVFLFGDNETGVTESTKVTIPASTDTTVIVLKPATGSYAVVADESLVFDVTHTTGQRATAVEELASAGIHTKTQA